MNIPVSWETAAALWVLGFMRSDDVAGLALEAMGTSRETDAIRRIVYGNSDPTEQLRLFGDALNEQDLARPPPTRAAHILARAICAKLLAANGSPFEAARTLALISRTVGDDFHDFDAFIYAESEAEDRPGDRQWFAEAILNEARRWAATPTEAVD